MPMGSIPNLDILLIGLLGILIKQAIHSSGKYFKATSHFLFGQISAGFNHLKQRLNFNLKGNGYAT